MAKPLKEEDRRLWREAMRGVRPLRPTRTVDDGPSQPPAAPAETRRDSAAAGPRTIAAAAPGAIDRRTLARIRRGAMPVEARLDLHGLTQEAAHRALVRFIAAAADGVRLALVITGKGRGGEGVLRAAVPRWLAEPPSRARILALTPAPPQHGGAGALCVLLRRRRGSAP